ncbi:MAG: prenyltransferase [Corynebacterium sp.]|uniref:prenyltransferase n=1 Tax=Corynebacterium sp. TaxID=1720 RepID=UPI0026DD4E85|nr:prenyltransferase [Corynebacterium sp.]MDO5099598.1 prenyltransferase [Corynebacterium sp.]
MLASILKASRPISWVNTAFPFGAAYLISGGTVDALFIAGVFFFLIPYNIAMYGINDVFDYESDIRNPRKGGIEGAVLSPKLHRPLLWAATITTLPFIIWFLVAGNLTSTIWLLISVGAVIAYSAPVLRFKERPVLDSITSSAHFTTPAIFGATITGGQVSHYFWYAIAAFFLWGMASHALGAVQDVQADREGGLQSIATVFGARLTTRLAAGAYLIAALLLFAMPSPAWVVGIAAVGYVVNTVRFWSITDETCEDVNRAWRVFLWMNYLSGALVTITLVSMYR